MPDVGAMIAFVKAATGREPDLVVGKPNPLIVDAGRYQDEPARGPAGMIGRSVVHGHCAGSGQRCLHRARPKWRTRMEDLTDSPFQPDYTFQNLAGVADWLEDNS